MSIPTENEQHQDRHDHEEVVNWVDYLTGQTEIWNSGGRQLTPIHTLAHCKQIANMYFHDTSKRTSRLQNSDSGSSTFTQRGEPKPRKTN